MGSLGGLKQTEDEEGPKVGTEGADAEDMVEIFKQQIAEIHQTLGNFPAKFRRIDESIKENLVQSELIASNRVKILEEHVNENSSDLEQFISKFTREKNEMITMVDMNNKMLEVFKQDYITKSGILKSLSGAVACLLESTCVKAFLEDATNEEKEQEIHRKGLLKNFTIENSLPSLARDLTVTTVPTLNNDLAYKNSKKFGEDPGPFQEIYVYRDVTKDVAENIYFKLINNATQIFNKNAEFRKMGYGLQEVFERTLTKKKETNVNKQTVLASETRTEQTDYSDVDIAKYSNR